MTIARVTLKCSTDSTRSSESAVTGEHSSKPSAEPGSKVKSTDREEWSPSTTVAMVKRTIVFFVQLFSPDLPVSSRVDRLTTTSLARAAVDGVAVIWAHTINAESPSMSAAVLGIAKVAAV